MDSSIWVAVITGFDARLHARMMFFWIWGTRQAGTSTPRSPRATMTPSAASRMASKFSTASEHSIFATILMPSPPCPSKNRRTARTPSASRTNDAATKSMSCPMPNSRSARSWSVSAGRGSAAPGTFTDLRSPSMPAFLTMQRMSVPSTSSTSSSKSPSSTRMDVPAPTAAAKPGQLCETSWGVPSTARSVSTIRLPAASSTGRPPARRPVRISGPRVSSSMAQGESSSPRTLRKRSMRARCSSCDPCEKLKRATSMPAPIRARSDASSSTDGPSVQTIFVRLAMLLLPPCGARTGPCTLHDTANPAARPGGGRIGSGVSQRESASARPARCGTGARCGLGRGA